MDWPAITEVVDLEKSVWGEKAMEEIGCLGDLGGILIDYGFIILLGSRISDLAAGRSMVLGFKCLSDFSCLEDLSALDFSDVSEVF